MAKRGGVTGGSGKHGASNSGGINSGSKSEENGEKQKHGYARQQRHGGVMA